MSAEQIIEASYRDLPAVVDSSQFMPIMSIEQAIARHEQIVQITTRCLKKDHDFGTIPGTPKPTLYKPGAEKLCSMFGLTPRPVLIEAVSDWTGEQHGGEPFFFYLYRMQLWRGDYLIAEADGSCNSWEQKYRYVTADRSCPKCKAATIRKGSEQFGGGWYCNAKAGGCGAKFPKGDASIERQDTGKKVNPNIADYPNTITKMAQKRALIAVVLLATNASEFYTQDVEDLAPTETTQEAPTQAAPEPTDWKALLDEMAQGYGIAKVTVGLIGKLIGRKVPAEVEDWGALYEEAYKAPDTRWQEVLNAKKPETPKPGEKPLAVIPAELSPEQDKAFTAWMENYAPDRQKFSEIVGRDLPCNEIGFATLADEELVLVNAYINTGVMPREGKLEVVAGGTK